MSYDYVEEAQVQTQTFSERLAELVSIQLDNGYRPGWVLYQLEEEFDTSEFSYDTWLEVAQWLGYSSGWAFHKSVGAE